MAKYENPPLKLEECTKEVITDFIRGTESVFRFDLFGEGKNEDLNNPFTTFDGKYHWSTNKDFFVYITDLTGTSDIRAANSKLYETFTKTPEYTEATMTSAPDSHVSSNRPSTEQLEQFGKEGEERAEKIKQTQVQARIEVENAIKRKEEIYASLKDKGVIVTPKEDLQKATLTPKEKARIWNLAQAVKTDREATKKAIEEKIRESVSKSSQEIQQNITDPIVKRTAADLIEKVTPFGVYKSAEEIPNDVTIINPLSPLVAISNPDDPKLKSLVPDDDVRIELAKSAQALSLSLEAKNNIDNALTKPLFEDSENISRVFYPQSIVQFQIADNQESKDEEDRGARIDLQKTYKEGGKIWNNWQKIKNGTTTVDKVVESTSVVPYPQITTTISTAGETASFLTIALPTTVGAITGFGTVTLANTFLLSGAHTTPLLANGFAQSLFLPSTTGIAISTPVFETIGGLEISTGALVTMSAPIAASEMIFNIPYGLAIGKGALLVATGEIASTGAPIIAFGVKIGQSGIGAVISSTGIKVAATGVFAEIGAALGSWAPIVGTAIGAAIGWVVGKIAEKIPWKKIAPFLLGGVAFLFAGPVVGAAVGVGSFVLISGVSGAALGATVGGVVSFFGALGGAFVGAIATPIIATILVIPVVVALILFIINSGAYITPPGAVSGGGFGTGMGGISCTLEQTPTGITYSVDSPIATRALHIVEDLYQGFWCYWNRSPGDLPTDVITYPPSYPDYFDYPRFLAQPNPSATEISNCPTCLFWCTKLVVEAYKAGGVIASSSLWAPTMKDDFNNLNKFLSNYPSQYPSKNLLLPTPINIVPGSVVFFHVASGHYNVNHVGVVYKVDSNGITFVQSNSGTKTGTLSYSSGVWSYVPGISVVGFGLP